MVSRVGQDLLRNTIRTVDYQNRVLEEKIMWRQKDLKEKIHHEDSQSSNRHKTKTKKIKHDKDKAKHKELKEHSRTERWDHNGFYELYPDVLLETSKTDSKANKLRKWDHSGFHKLYPDTALETSRTKSNKRKKKKKTTKKEKCKKSKRHSS